MGDTLPTGTMLSVTHDALALQSGDTCVIDLTFFSANIELNDTLDILYAASLASGAADVNWIVQGYTGESHDDYPLGAYWNDATLKVGWSAIPEPAMAGALVGQGALTLAMRRRR